MSKMVKSKAISVCLVATLLSGGVAVAGNEESDIGAKPFIKWVGGKNQQIPQLPDELIERLRLQQDNYRACADDETRKSFYLAARERYNQGNLDAIETAALFIFLNRTCFNGLYRVNAKGKFNVPFWKAVNPLICDEKTIRTDSVLLRKVEILNDDFEAVLSKVKRSAFFYFDPPYRPLTDTAAFTA